MSRTSPAGSSRPLALITGASSGIGEAFARFYAANGYDVALVARREDRLRKLADALSASHGMEALVIPADLAGWEAWRLVLQGVASQGRHVDVLVNNAGFSIPQSFAAVPWDRQRDFLMTLVVNACGLMHGVLPSMTERRSGAIINVASLAGLAPGAAGHSLYPGAKSLMIKLTQSLAAEYGDKGVRITAVCPGFTLTEFAQVNDTQKVMDQAPRRLFQTADQVVRAAVGANARGRVVVVPGWHNQLAAFVLQYFPQSLVRAAILRGSAKYHLAD